jgi:hypothetical protein
MRNRGYEHRNDLDRKLATGTKIQIEFVNSYEEQIKILKKKNCTCEV